MSTAGRVVRSVWTSGITEWHNVMGKWGASLTIFVLSAFILFFSGCVKSKFLHLLPEPLLSFWFPVLAPLSFVSFLSAASTPMFLIQCSCLCLEWFWLPVASPSCLYLTWSCWVGEGVKTKASPTGCYRRGWGYARPEKMAIDHLG